MKLLFVYYSRTGLTERAVQTLKDALTDETMKIPREHAVQEARERLGVDVRLIRVEAVKKPGFLRAAWQSLRKRPAAIHEMKPPPDLSGYDALVLAGPIWASNLCSPLRAFLLRYHGVKKLFVVHTHSSESASPAATATIAELTGVTPSAVLELCTIKGDLISEQVRVFAKTVRASLTK